MSDEHDDGDRTNPDLGGDEPTNPGVGLGEAYIAVDSMVDRAFEAVRKLAGTCPKPGEPGRKRHLEVLANAWGDLGMLCFDERRVTTQLHREEDEG